MNRSGWRDIPGWEGLYEANSRGQIRRIGGSFMLGGLGCKGYRLVTLCRDGLGVTVNVHRAMAATWIGPCPAGMQINHKDGNPMNNRVENLEYVTPQRNSVHAFELGLRPIGDAHWTRRMPWLVKRGQENGNSKTARARREAERQNHA
jgi:hypothetical protein